MMLKYDDVLCTTVPRVLQFSFEPGFLRGEEIVDVFRCLDEIRIKHDPGKIAVTKGIAIRAKLVCVSRNEFKVGTFPTP